MTVGWGGFQATQATVNSLWWMQWESRVRRAGFSLSRAGSRRSEEKPRHSEASRVEFRHLLMNGLLWVGAPTTAGAVLTQILHPRYPWSPLLSRAFHPDFRLYPQALVLEPLGFSFISFLMITFSFPERWDVILIIAQGKDWASVLQCWSSHGALGYKASLDILPSPNGA